MTEGNEPQDPGQQSTAQQGGSSAGSDSQIQTPDPSQLDPVKLLEAKRQANQEAKSYRLKLEEQEKELEALRKEREEKRQAEMSEIDRLKEQTLKLQEDNATLQQQTLEMKLKLDVSSQGVKPEYVDYMTMEYAKAKSKGLEAADFFKAAQEATPIFFGISTTATDQQPPPRTAGGHQRPGETSRLQEVKAQIEKLEANPYRTQDQNYRLSLLVDEQARLERKK